MYSEAPRIELHDYSLLSILITCKYTRKTHVQWYILAVRLVYKPKTIQYFSLSTIQITNYYY